MTKRWRKRLIITSAVLSVFGVVLFAGGVYTAGSILAMPCNHPVAPPSDDLPLESVRIQSVTGEDVAGWFIPGDRLDRAALLLHPLGATRRAMWRRAGLLWHAGYNVLLIDLQGHGESPGRHVTFGYLESESARAAVDYLKKRLPDAAIIVNGWSLGAATAILADPPLDVEALVLEAPYSTIEEATWNRIGARVGALPASAFTPLLLMQLEPRLGVRVDQLQPVERLREIDTPVLLIAGDKDDRTTLAQSKRLYEAAAGPKAFWVLRNRGHEDFYRAAPEEYERRVLAFLRKHLGP